MTKALCKYSRHDIKAGKAEPLVANAQFYCTSCARSSNQKKALCKPVVLGLKHKAVHAQSTLVRFEAKPMARKAPNVADVVAKAKALKQQRDYLEQASIEEKGNGVNVMIPSPLLEKPQTPVIAMTEEVPVLEAEPMPILTSIELDMKRLKVSLKSQKKQQKQLKKLLKKQKKLAKKNKKVLKQERKLAKHQQKIAKQEAKIERRLSVFSQAPEFDIAKPNKAKVTSLKALH
ncbi:hypothetical protein [Vibrio gangliei]|uniref:hypothetical protein n=1 Tax=Vibrio gangliei TaxID=2077090 RepID=UPI000D01B131|nr:hypothetical protein [Vibrio gangliei]